ncbi:MAG: hypothetical protein PHO56_00180 [Patescibacteria group bacterium]|nr:hypothetical protein [Patescibacteria group bacterium]
MKNLEKIGYIEYIWPPDHEQKNWAVHVFSVKEWEGELRDGGEGELRWFKRENFPRAEMWDDDQYWLKDALSGKFSRLRFYLDEAGKTIRFEKI